MSLSDKELREISERVAVEVMGWRKSLDGYWRTEGDPSYCGAGYTFDGRDYDFEDFDPAQEISHAWKVVEKIRVQGHRIGLDSVDLGWLALIDVFTPDETWDGGGYYGEQIAFTYETAPLAICKAALKVASLNTTKREGE